MKVERDSMDEKITDLIIIIIVLLTISIISSIVLINNGYHIM